MHDIQEEENKYLQICRFSVFNYSSPTAFKSNKPFKTQFR